MRLGFALVLVAACHSAEVPNWQPDAGACEPYVVPSGMNLMAPAVTFSANVLPVLAHSCTSASCHGGASPQGALDLGQAANTYTNLVGPLARELSTMPFVMPGHPDESYLMHKLDADQCTLASQCVSGDCKQSMPLNNPLDASSRDTIRRWIVQGAQNN